MTEEALPTSLQESLLALLAFDNVGGAAVAMQLRTEHFDSPYQEIATQLLAYRARYGRPPGTTHLDDLFGRGLQQGERATRLRRLLTGLTNLSHTLNPDYLMHRVSDFIRAQTLKAAVLRAGELYQGGGVNNIKEVERVLYQALSHRVDSIDRGTFLHDQERALSFLDHSPMTYGIGIKELDDIGFGATVGELLLYIAPKGCFVGDTLIDCPRDLSRYPLGIPIKDLVGKQFSTYSWDFEQQKPCVSRVADVWCSGNKPVYRVRLSAKLRQKLGKKGGGTRRAKYLPPLELVGTYDHPVLLADGSWKKLGELQLGDSLKSLYRRAESDGGGYCCLRWTGDDPEARPIREHQFVCAAANGPRPGTGEEFDTHHKNEKACDNTPDNLEWKFAKAHAADHLAEANRRGTTGWRVNGVHPRGMRGKQHTVQTKERQREAAVRITATRQRNPSGQFVNHTVISSVEYVGVRKVFDMEVEGSGNYVANGVFVHNSGKTWFCVHMGTGALKERENGRHANVLHISNEVSEPRIAMRYLQRIFGVARYTDPSVVAALELDTFKKVVDFHQVERRPEYAFSQEGIKEILRNKMSAWGVRLGSIVIKQFASGQLTVPELRSYLDYLEVQEHFIPNMLIVDYPDLMRMEGRDHRIALGRTFVDLRGTAVERSMALICPTQGQRSTIGARKVRSSNVTEDISKVFTADNVLTYSQTDDEEPLGLARLYVDYARHGAAKQEFVITQGYTTGQYMLQYARMSAKYWDKIKPDQETTTSDDDD